MKARSMASMATTLNAMGDGVRAEVVGSLLRPSALVELRKRLEAGELSAADFKREEDHHVEAAIRMQEDAGIDVVTDGEQSRYAFFGHLVESFDGFDKEGGWAIPFRDEKGEELIFKRPVVVGRLRWRHSMCAEDWTFLRAKARRPGKVTMISAQQAAAYYDPEKSHDAYPTRDAYLADIVDVSRREIDELVRLGCTYVQIDAPQYAALLDPKIRAGYRERGSDPEQLIDRCIELDNAIIENHPGVTFAIHICRGNNQSKFYAEGDYEPISRIFEKTLFNRFLLEYGDKRREAVGEAGDRYALLLGGVALADRHRAIAQRLEVDRDAERRSDLILTAVPPSDVAAGLVVLHTELPLQG